MGSFTVNAVYAINSIGSDAQPRATRKPVPARYHAFLDEETVTIAQDDVTLSEEAIAQAKK